MSFMLDLVIEKRDKIGKASKRREGGLIPAVFYGPKESSTPISLSDKDFLNVWKQVGESSVISLTGIGEPKEVLIQDVDRDPITGGVRHVDFYVIEKGKKIEVNVPIVFVGEAPAVKDLGGMLVKVLHEISVEVMPKDLPHEITVDISGLVDFDAQVHAKDIILPSEVTMLTGIDEVVVLAAPAKEEEIEETVEDPDLESIEVEKKGKENDSEETAEDSTNEGK